MREVGITSNWPCMYVMNKTNGEKMAAQDQNPLALRSNILRCVYRRNSIANKVITTKTSKLSGTEVACNILLINIAGRKHKYIANPYGKASVLPKEFVQAPQGSIRSRFGLLRNGSNKFF
jgi:hypothetical protein